ncbi:hypothetical protein D5S18_11000 [Nocardia panacis]|uniref:Uncharacterized protein n=1 Tax=Nocardia panacis TaxID=2340916 RepID=A0A3A4L333_9NOCA|nr:hypothetical protein D5S18_11000 [Nocardia panacis]
MSTGEERDAIRLAESWEAHVEKIDRDRSLPWSDRTVWNEYDLCAALLIRDRLESAIRKLPEPVASKMNSYATGADERFMSITVEDSGKRMAAVAKIDLAGQGWWWFRIPDSGPIIEDLARWSRFEE